MLEIVLICLLCQRNVRNAELRGKHKGSVIASTIFLWLFFEIIGLILAWTLIKHLGYPNYGVFYIAAIGIGCGLIGAYIAYKISLKGIVLPERIPHDPVVFEFDSYEQIEKPCRVILHRDKDYSLTIGKVDFFLNGEQVCNLGHGDVCTLQTYLRKNVFVVSKNKKELPTYPYTFVVPEDGEIHIYFDGFEFDHKKTFISKGQIMKKISPAVMPPIPSANQYCETKLSAIPRFCQYCGNARNEGDKFCRFCGVEFAK